MRFVPARAEATRLRQPAERDVSPSALSKWNVAMSVRILIDRTAIASRMAPTRWSVLAAWLGVATLSAGFWIEAVRFITAL